MEYFLTVLLIILGTIPVCTAFYQPELRAYRDHPCIRPCELNSPMTCVYNFTLETYHVMSFACGNCPFNKTDCSLPHCVPADGVPRFILTVNRMLPGPGIHVCEGDEIVVNVLNLLSGAEGTSIHWHGLLQRGTQHMDGADMVTQCPIAKMATFQYRFGADNAGTHYWHAHSGSERADGLAGAIVIRQALAREPHAGLYEEDLPEHTIVIGDWLHRSALGKLTHLMHAPGGGNAPTSMLINGKGMFREYFDPASNTTTHTPCEVFRVQQGTRYRFRLISNGILICPIQVSIDSHTLTMIATDSYPIEKVDNVHSFTVMSGERFDFVLNASMPAGNYWIRARGLTDCERNNVSQVAILRYEGAPDENPAGDTKYEDANRQGKQLNPSNERAADDRILVSSLTYRPLDPENVTPFPALKEIPDHKHYLALDFNMVNFDYRYHDENGTTPTLTFLPQINHISSLLPYSPLLTQLGDIEKDEFCNDEDVGDMDCEGRICHCVHRIKVPVNEVVELLIFDEGQIFDVSHPMHLHGFGFHVVGMDKLDTKITAEEIKQLDEDGQLPRNLNMSAKKDTVVIPDGGYVILRFYTDNPGFWFFHCHVEFHLDLGMSLIFQVGDQDDMPPVPRNFPTCGNWQFTGYEDTEETTQTTTTSTTTSTDTATNSATNPATNSATSAPTATGTTEDPVCGTNSGRSLYSAWAVGLAFLLALLELSVTS